MNIKLFLLHKGVQSPLALVLTLTKCTVDANRGSHTALLGLSTCATHSFAFPGVYEMFFRTSNILSVCFINFWWGTAWCVYGIAEMLNANLQSWSHSRHLQLKTCLSLLPVAAMKKHSNEPLHFNQSEAALRIKLCAWTMIATVALHYGLMTPAVR